MDLNQDYFERYDAYPRIKTLLNKKGKVIRIILVSDWEYFHLSNPKLVSNEEVSKAMLHTRTKCKQSGSKAKCSWVNHVAKNFEGPTSGT